MKWVMGLVVGGLFVVSAFAEDESGKEKAPESGKVQSLEGDENLLRNGNFEQGKSGWTTHGTVVERDGGKSKALEIDLRAREDQTSSVKIRFGQKRNLVVSFTVEVSDDFKSERDYAIKAYFEEGLFINYYTVPQPKGEDRRIRLRYTVKNSDIREIVMRLEVPPGTGKLYLSDVVVTGTSR